MAKNKSTGHRKRPSSLQYVAFNHSHLNSWSCLVFPTQLFIPFTTMFDLCFWFAMFTELLCHSSFIKNSWANPISNSAISSTPWSPHRWWRPIPHSSSVGPWHSLAFAKILRSFETMRINDMRMKSPKHGKHKPSLNLVQQPCASSSDVYIYIYICIQSIQNSRRTGWPMATSDLTGHPFFFGWHPLVSLGSRFLPDSTCAWQGNPNDTGNKMPGHIGLGGL